MPELPEVESLRLELNEASKGQAIKSIDLRRENLRYPFQDDLSQKIIGKIIDRVERRAKFIVFELNDHTFLVSHLGMTGSWNWIENGFEYSFRSHDHVVIELDRGKLIYNDPRRFGHLFHGDSFDKIKKPFDLSALGVEPFSKDFNSEYLLAHIKNRKSANLKSVIMDQQVVVGVGNIYASEALFLAKVKPTRKFSTLKAIEAKALVKSIVKVLSAGIKAGGTTLRDYRSLGQGKGNYQLRLKVYDRAGQPCTICRTKIKTSRIAGRSTYWCQKCQK
jgi:formamidopyrimidine-DNA glycosylase